MSMELYWYQHQWRHLLKKPYGATITMVDVGHSWGCSTTDVYSLNYMHWVKNLEIPHQKQGWSLKGDITDVILSHTLSP